MEGKCSPFTFATAPQFHNQVRNCFGHKWKSDGSAAIPYCWRFRESAERVEVDWSSDQRSGFGGCKLRPRGHPRLHRGAFLLGSWPARV